MKISIERVKRRNTILTIPYVDVAFLASYYCVAGLLVAGSVATLLFITHQK